VDAVIHTATCYGRNGETAAEIFEANTVFPLRLLETATYFNSGIFFNTDTFFNSESKFNTGSFNYKYLNYYMLSKKHFYEWGKLYANNKKICFVNIRLEHVFGPGDDSSKFTSQVINSCLANISELKLTPGEQKRDFIYVDNVVDAYEVLLEKVINQSNLFQEYELGSGKAVTIREFVETVHKLTKSTTRLNFGALPYREDEIMNSEANIEKLDCLGWRCKISLIDGISEIISKNYLNP
jgi:nucleoside-diphosphate-sugar epimerase